MAEATVTKFCMQVEYIFLLKCYPYCFARLQATHVHIDLWLFQSCSQWFHFWILGPYLRRNEFESSHCSSL